MKPLLITFSLFFFNSLAFCADISVGLTKISVPEPDGYSVVTKNMNPFAEYATRFVPPTNEQFALFIPTTDISIAANGGMPESERKFFVQTAKSMIRRSISSSEFSQIKRMATLQNKEIFDNAALQMPDLLKEVNKGIKADFGVVLNLSMDMMIPLSPHYETERILAFSTIVKYGSSDENGRPSVYVGVVTTTIVHLNGKVLTLMSIAEKSALQWSRAESRKWANMVVAANSL